MAGTLADMKVRIAQELGRADLLRQIGTAISDSITFYQNVRLSFNSGGTVLILAPVTDSEVNNLWMTTAESLIRTRSKHLIALGVIRDDAMAAKFAAEEQAFLAQLQYRVVSAATTPSTLGAMKARIADEIEHADLTPQIANAIADAITFYQNVRLSFNNGGSTLVAAPATDGETNNLWMTTAESLIRTRAKHILALSVLHNNELVTTFAAEEQAFLAQLQFRVVSAATTPGTLGAMKARIADEIARSDLTPQISNAITTAISEYQKQRFRFSDINPGVPPTFNTVNGLSVYGVTDNPNLASIYFIDYLNIAIGNTLQQLDRVTPEEQHLNIQLSTSSGMPSSYAYEGNYIILYPVPDQVWTIYIGGHIQIAAPATDNQTGNPWMTSAELLIRSRAKYELAVHILNDSAMAAAMSPEPGENGQAYRAWRSLKGEGNKITGMSRVRPMRW